ncbi:sorting nexin-21 [Anolis sagrei]|uniref:sorting nexin-21 n=1 Tax=Anolis sagrei TaxID=38937 RepID=UPI003520C675
MASRILHRLRHALTGEGQNGGALAGCGSEAEDFPESSELEDDLEGLSTRLSGTLSFTSNEEEEEDEEEDGEEDGEEDEEEDEEEEDDSGAAVAARKDQGAALDPERLGASEDGECSPTSSSSSSSSERRGSSNLLTRQLQELWRRSRGSFVPQRLLFEVTSANVVSERNSKYVLYTIYLIRTGQFDKSPATIARRYSDFDRLNRRLRRRFGADLAGVSFPRKRLRRNFAAETIAKRSRAFEGFLAHLHALPEVRRSAEFLEFFFLEDLRHAQRLTCGGLYREALAAWDNARRLQEKLAAGHSGHFLVTLAGLAVCQQELDRPAEALAACEEALRLLGAQDSHPLVGPFLQAHVRLAWALGRDKREAEARLLALQERGPSPPPSLKEVLIKQTLP